MIELPGWLLVTFVLVGTGYLVAPKVEAGAKKVCHGVVRVVTLGHKDVCKAEPPAAKP